MVTSDQRSFGMQCDDLLSLHRRLSAFNRRRLAPSLERAEPEAQLLLECAVRQEELRFVERERAQVQARAAQAPHTPEGFVAWFEALEATGPGQHDPLFPFLAHHATREQMCWFLRQEMAGEAGFDDLVALTQVKLALRPKLELARNYWDEMGRGHVAGVHGLLLSRLGEELRIAPGDDASWQTLALGNLMVALACNRCYAYQSIGALGVIELTAPGRSLLVNQGLKRLRVDGEARRYFALHATLDVKHSQCWNREVIVPLVAQDPRIARALAEGALMRLAAGARCFAWYREQLGLPERSAPEAA